MSKLMDGLERFAGKPRALTVVGVICILLVFLQGWFNPFYQGNVYDSYSYYYAAQAINEGKNPYDRQLLTVMGWQDNIEIVYPYLYPPLLAGLWRPLTALPPRAAHKSTVIINTLLLALVLVMVFKLVAPKSHPHALKLLFLLFLPLNIGVEMTLRQGQVNPLVMLGIIGCLYFHLKDKNALAALFLAIAIMLKLTPALLLLYFIPFYRRRWPFLGWLVIWSVVLVLISFVLTSPYYWLEFITSSQAGPPFRNFDSFWGTLDLAGKFHPIFGSLKIVLYLIISLPLLVISYISIRNHPEKERPVYAFSLLVLLSLFLSPLTWPHHYFLALLPYFYFPARYWGENRNREFAWYVILVFIALINVPKAMVLPLGRYALIGIRAVRTGANFLACLLSVRQLKAD
jgi:alpha-1,2-mannosyltransferase